MYFVIADFRCEISKFRTETSHKVRNSQWFTEKQQFASNIVLITKHLVNSTILLRKNGGFKTSRLGRIALESLIQKFHLYEVF